MRRLGIPLVFVLIAVCLLGALCLPALTPSAFADDANPAAAAASADGETAQGLDALLMANPKTLLTIIVLKFLPLAIGAVLLILWWLKRDKIRGGMLPPPAPVEPTVAFGISSALVLLAAGMLVLPALFSIALAPLAPKAAPTAVASAPETTGAEGADASDTGLAPRAAEDAADGTVEATGAAPLDEAGKPPAASGPAKPAPPSKSPLWVQLLAMALGSLPVASVVLLRRRFMGRATPEQRAILFPVNTPTPTPAPGPVRAFGIGWWGFCIATAIVVPVGLVWALLLESVGVGAQLQELVTRVYSGGPAYEPYLIAGFGVLVAPFVEETLFRGLLYPALRRSLGGTRQAAWQSAILVSLVFAAIHGNWVALLPLFSLAMVLAWIMEKTNSLAACVLAHAVHNAFALIPLLMLRGA
jgi:membrane protease YdiL (CAAX protease family)